MCGEGIFHRHTLELTMYYGLVILAVMMFGLQFLANKQYQKETGSGVFQAMLFNLFGCALGLPVLFFINRGKFEYTHFTLLMSCINFCNGFLFTLCALKAFERVNLSVFSLLSMLGGMVLPLLAGVLFFNEKMTWGIAICVVCIVVALSLTVEKNKEKKKGGLFFYIGVFVFNGMSGVISKIYTDAPYTKASSAGFSILTAIVTATVSLLFILILWKKRSAITKKTVLFGVVAGPLSRVANYLLLLALTILPASVNYPMVTGGTMLVSTIIAYFTAQKPKKKEWLAVVLSLIGILFLTLLPV